MSHCDDAWLAHQRARWLRPDHERWLKPELKAYGSTRIEQDFRVSAAEIAEQRQELAEIVELIQAKRELEKLSLELAFVRNARLVKALHPGGFGDESGTGSESGDHWRNQPRVLAGNSDGGQWTAE